MLPKSGYYKAASRRTPLNVPLNQNASILRCRHNPRRRANFASSAILRLQNLNSNYGQIPEYLKIHTFTPELEILRHDELRAPFENFSSSFIIKLLEERANEIRFEKPNSNPASRLNNENVVRFMKVLSRLKQLFSVNGGNTQVLDAVLQSQSAPDKLEAKLTETKREKATKLEPTTHLLSLYATGPYIQIPESLGIHDFSPELEILKTHELKKSYAEVPAKELINFMEKRLKEVYEETAESFPEAGITKQNLIRFYNLLAKLKKLLAWNGGCTAVLDTLLRSQEVFKSVEKQIQARRSITSNSQRNADFSGESATEYRQIPKDVFLEEYYEELKELKDVLKSDFGAVLDSTILKAVIELSRTHKLTEKGLVYSKLYRNLVRLFHHNNGLTFVLDTVLVNRDEFDRFEARLSARTTRADATGSPVSQMGTAPKTVEQTSTRESQRIMTLLNQLQKHGSSRDECLGEEEITIQSALAKAMSKEEKSLHESDPQEYEEVTNLTSEKIRSKYRLPGSTKLVPKIRRDQVEKYLRNVKHKKEIAEENKWREQTAFEWSQSHCKHHRSFGARNFFDPILTSGRTMPFPMFPGLGEEHEFLILTSNGQKFHTHKNPLGINHVPEDMFAILQTLSDEELAKFLKNVEKLRRKGWRLIGSGKTRGMLVLSRETKDRRYKLGRAMMVLLAATGFGFVSLIAINWLIDEESIEEMQRLTARHNQQDDYSGIDGNFNPENSHKNEDVSESPSWKALLWKK